MRAPLRAFRGFEIRRKAPAGRPKLSILARDPGYDARPRPSGPQAPTIDPEVKETMSIFKSTGLLAAVILVSACGSSPKPPPAAPAANTEPPKATAAPTASQEKPDDDATRGQINISDEIKKACGITDAEAYFDFDSANVQGGARAVLTKLAKCFADGPLKGRKMNLVGHADPRGEEEYNMVLGGRRADNVKHFLVTVGLPDAQAMTTSRGEMDATGTDDASWAKDRRVDVVLAN